MREITGDLLEPKCEVVRNPQTNRPEVSFEWKSEGAVLFEQITGDNIGKPLYIFRDGLYISSPNIQEELSKTGVITGLSLEEAEALKIQLNAGALPVPLGRWNADHTEFLVGEPLSEETV